MAVPFWSERAEVVRYREGTVNVDLVDARERRLVWEGVAVGSAAGRDPAERRQRAVQAVAAILAELPGAPPTSNDQ